MGKLVNIQELPQTPNDESRLAWQLALDPRVDPDGFFLNTSAANRDIRAAGLGGAIVRAYDGDSETREWSLGGGARGVNPDGSLTGASPLSVSWTRVMHGSLEDTNAKMYQRKWPIATIAVDRSALARRVDRDVQRGRPRDEAVARRLDHTIRLGILAQGAEVLVKKPLEENLFKVVHPTLLASLIWPWLVKNQSPLLGSGLLYGAYHAASVWLCGEDARRMDQPLRMRWGLWPLGLQPDRLGLVAFPLIASRRLLTVREPHVVAESEAADPDL